MPLYNPESINPLSELEQQASQQMTLLNGCYAWDTGNWGLIRATLMDRDIVRFNGCIAVDGRTTTMFNLPAKYRPAKNRMIAVPGYWFSSNWYTTVLLIEPNGNVSCPNNSPNLISIECSYHLGYNSTL